MRSTSPGSSSRSCSRRLTFLLIGLAISPGQLAAALPVIVAGFVAITIAGLLVVYGGHRRRRAAHPAGPLPLPLGYLHVMFWAGLRGAVAVALALALPKSVPDRDLLTGAVFGVVLMTLLVQGTTAGWVVRRAGVVDQALDRVPRATPRNATRSLQGLGRPPGTGDVPKWPVRVCWRPLDRKTFQLTDPGDEFLSSRAAVNLWRSKGSDMTTIPLADGSDPARRLARISRESRGNRERSSPGEGAGRPDCGGCSEQRAAGCRRRRHGASTRGGVRVPAGRAAASPPRSPRDARQSRPDVRRAAIAGIGIGTSVCHPALVGRRSRNRSSCAAWPASRTGSPSR